VFTRIGRWCYRNRLVVVLLWVAVAVIGGIGLGAVGTDTRTEFTLPDVESRAGVDIFDEHFDGAGGGQTAPVVFVAEQGVDDPEVEAAITSYLAEVDALDDSLRVTSPYSEEGAGQVATTGEYAGRLAYAEIEVPTEMSFEAAADLGKEIRELDVGVAGVDVDLGGEMFVEFEEPTAELVGLAFAIVILIVAFGSVIAMGLPIGVGLAGIGVGTILAGFLSNVFEVPDFAQMLGVMIGLGVGIDYALFIVTRFRENRARGRSVEQSVVGAINTAGRAVTFAGITVVISLLGMLIMQLGFITGMAISVATVVVVTMVASITLLPALIGFVSHRIEITRWRGVIAAGFVSLALLGAAVSQPAISLTGLVFALGILLAGFAVRGGAGRGRPPPRPAPRMSWSMESPIAAMREGAASISASALR
jgi:putative drug exporter of the RND superfamily